MNNISPRVRQTAVAAAIAALYAALTILLAPISYGAIQCRISEALCVLPFLFPQSAFGLFIGCLLANLMTGNVMDIVFGSLATLLAALCTAYCGKKSRSRGSALLACLMPVLFNAVIVGAVITGAYEGLNIFQNIPVFLFNAFTVGIGEAIALYAVGYPLLVFLPKSRLYGSLAA